MVKQHQVHVKVNENNWINISSGELSAQTKRNVVIF